MQYHKMTVKHNPPESYGDCVRTAIGCLLYMKPEDVPHFFDGDPDPAQSWQQIADFLNARGYGYFIMPFDCEIEIVLAGMSANARDCLYLLFGHSRNNAPHVVVCQNDKIIHDPSWVNVGVPYPSGEGFYYALMLIENRFRRA